MLVARLDLRFAGLTQSFTTRNTAERPHRLHMHLVEGPLKTLEGEFTFTALGGDGCKIALALDFEYAGLLAGACAAARIPGPRQPPGRRFLPRRRQDLWLIRSRSRSPTPNRERQFLRKVVMPCRCDGRRCDRRIRSRSANSRSTHRRLRTGVWSKPVARDALLNDGDRVELYRPLTADPKEARRRRRATARRVSPDPAAASSSFPCPRPGASRPDTGACTCRRPGSAAPDPRGNSRRRS